MKRLLLSFGGACLCIALTIAILLAGKSAISGSESAAGPEMTLETPEIGDLPEATGEDPSGEDVLAALPGDSVSPPATPSPVTTAPLDAPAETASRPASGELEETVLRHPVAISAGLIRFEDRQVQLEGLKPQSADRVCPSATEAWPCGMVARTALRNFIRARALVCQTPKAGWSGTITARCMIGRDDPAVWLAENGWAEAEPGAPVEADVENARKLGKGFYRRPTAVEPPSGTPDPASDPMPDESLSPSGQ